MAYELNPAGPFKGRVTAATLSPGYDGIEAYVFLEVLSGPAKGKTIRWNGRFGDRAERTVRTLRKCGWEGDDLSDLKTCLGNEVEGEIVHKASKGKTYANVYINSAVLKPEQLKGFAEQMKPFVKSVGAGEEDPALIDQGADPASLKIDDDDIPY